MKSMTSVLMLTLLASVTYAGRVKDMATKTPEAIIEFIRTASYHDLLQFLKDTDAERAAAPDDSILEYVFVMALNEVPRDKTISMNLDVALVSVNLTTRQMGVMAVYHALVDDPQPDQATRDRLLKKLKEDLAKLTTPGREAFHFARYAVDVLVLMGDDAGLDALLTDAEQMRTLGLKDKWKPDTDEARFEQLASQYTEKANDPANKNNGWEKTVAAMYRLAKNRRAQGREIRPLSPIVNLDHLLKNGEKN